MQDPVALSLAELGSEDIMYGFEIERDDVDAFMDAFASLVKHFKGIDFAELLKEDEE